MFFCCLDGWRRVVCVLDNIQHKLPHRLQSKRLCDLHDNWITRKHDLDEVDVTAEEFDQMWRDGVEVDIAGPTAPPVAPGAGG